MFTNLTRAILVLSFIVACQSAFASVRAPGEPTPQEISSSLRHNDTNNAPEISEIAKSISNWIIRTISSAWRWLNDSSGVMTLILTAALVFVTSRLAGITRDVAEAANQSAKIAGRSASASEQSAKVAKATLVVTQRPWVTIDLRVGGPLIYNVNGLNVTLLVILRNIGKSPALNVWVEGQPVAPAIGVDHEFNSRSVQEEIIEKLKVAPPVPFGHTIFPGREISYESTWSIGVDELKRLTQKVDFVHLSILGAVTYRTGLDDGSHQTAFSVDIQRSDAPRLEAKAKNRNPCGVFPDEGDIPATELRLIKSVFAINFAN